MSRFFSCCCGSRGAEPQSQGANMSMVEFDKLMSQPMNMDTNLETAVSNWEKTINIYRDYETAILEDLENHPACDAILSVLEDLRDHPEKYTDNPAEDVAILAKMRVDVYNCQQRLGLPREAMSGSNGSRDINDADYDGKASGNPMHENKGPIPGSDSSTSHRPVRQKTVFEETGNSSALDPASNSTCLSALKLPIMQQRIQSLRADPLLHRSIATLQTLETNPDYKDNKHRSVGYETSSESALTSAELKELQTRRAKEDRDRTGGQAATKQQSTLKANLKSEAITNQLSVTWAGRLDTVDMTQGQLSAADLDGGAYNAAAGGAAAVTNNPNNHHRHHQNNKIVKIKPKWPHFLLDIWFDVIKWNDWGKRQRRIIKLTEYHILNIKNGNTISKLYWYVDISRIWMENSNTLKFVLKGRESPICYISPMAPSIVQQITTRVQVRIALEKTIFTATHNMYSADSSTGGVSAYAGFTGFSQSAAAEMINAIGAEADTVGDLVMADFAHGLVNKISGVNIKSGGNERKKVKNQPRLFVFSEGSLEDMVQKEVQKVVFDVKTDEGHTRSVFIETFDGFEAVPKQKSLTKVMPRGGPKAPAVPKKTNLDVRHFIDGLHEYYLSSRGIEMAIIILAWIKEHDLERESESENSMSASTRPSRSGSISTVGTDADETSLSDVKVRRSRARRESMSGVPRSSIRGIKHVQDISSLSEEYLATLSFISFTVIEEAVFLPLRDSIIERLPSHSTDKDEELVKKIKRFAGRTQEQWGIPSELHSPLKWETACFELSGIERASTPSMQLMSLARACKAITSEFKNCIVPEMKKTGKTDCYLGADNLVPIFVYVFCQAALQTPHLHKELMWTLCHPDQLHGECGYYLTVFESAIEYVEIEPLDDIPMGVELSTTTSSIVNDIGMLDDEGISVETDADGEQYAISASSSISLGKFGGVNLANESMSQKSIQSCNSDTSITSALSLSSSSTTSGSSSGKMKTRRLTVGERVGVAVGLRAPPKLTMHRDFTDNTENTDNTDDTGDAGGTPE